MMEKMALLPAGRLVPAHDRFHAHTTLGLVALLHFAARIFASLALSSLALSLM
jgi:hypothetical protein